MHELEPLHTDSAALREIYGLVPTGVVAVCAFVDDEPVGISASSFTCVSMEPPLVSLCIQTTSTTWPRLRSCPRLGISVLSEEQHNECLSLSQKTGDRFQKVDWSAGTEAGSVFLSGATLWLECTLHDELPAGDHTIALLEIRAAKAWPAIEPLVFHTSRFRRLNPV